MSEKLIQLVQEELRQDRFTRATIINYSQSNFVDLAEIIDKAYQENCSDEIKAVCDEHLEHGKDSKYNIMALYISGMIALKKGTLDNSALTNLISLFQDNHKASIVSYLCEAILDIEEGNKFALRTLSECYKTNNDPRLWQIYETLVRVDPEEADVARILAGHYEKEQNLELAISFYKKAIHRYINNGSVYMPQIKEIWSKLISLIPEEIDFFYLAQKKITKKIEKEQQEKNSLMMGGGITDIERKSLEKEQKDKKKSTELIKGLYEYYKRNENWDTAIEILKIVFSIDSDDSKAKDELVSCYRKKYEQHSQLEEFIEKSDFFTSRNIFDAIAQFEKRVAFDTRNFVFHRSWGVGVIQKVQDDHLTINFGTKHGKKEMISDMAIKALQPLAPDHIWVLKATKNKDELIKMVKNNKAWTLKTIIKSYGNNCDFKHIKAELVPSILSQGEWTSWSTSARKILESDPMFGINPDDINMYTVRSHAISQEEKLANEFKAQKQFFARIDILMKFALEADTDSEHFLEMFSYFTGYLKSVNSMTEQIMAAYLVVRSISAFKPHLNPGYKHTFGELFAKVRDPKKMYLNMKDTKYWISPDTNDGNKERQSLRNDFLNCIRNFLPNWGEIYTKLFPSVLQDNMLTQLENNGYIDAIKKLAVESFEDYRSHRGVVLYFFEKCKDKEWFKEVDIPYEKQLVTIINILDLAYREIANHVDTSENRKITRQIHQLLFNSKENSLLNYIIHKDKDTIKRIYTRVHGVAGLDPAITDDMRKEILKRYPDFEFPGAEEKPVTQIGFIVTAKMMDEKKKELEHILKIDIPNNSKEIEEAREQGDLKENAEYKAAKERQHELSSKATRLEEEINKARIFDPATLTTDHVSFGTRVILKNLDTNTTEEYTILGAWESNPDKRIISYLSPLGKNLLNSKEADQLNFEVNGHNYSFAVEKILAAEM